MGVHIAREGIRCQRCNEIFFDYVQVIDLFDADSCDDADKDIVSGLVNRVVCSFCNNEFTFETPLVIYSYLFKFIICTDCNMYEIPARKFKVASVVSGSTDWKFRKTSFTADAAEKVRIFKNNLDDGIIEKIKLKYIEEYRHLNITDEYVTYEAHDEENLYFSKRDDSDNLLKNYTLPFRLYEEEMNAGFPVPTGDWLRIDREWAIKQTEEKL